MSTPLIPAFHRPESITARRRQRLHDFLERRQRLASRAVGRQRRIACGGKQRRMRLAGKAQHAGDRDVGVADTLAEPPGVATSSRAFSSTSSTPPTWASQRSTQIFDGSFRSTRS